MSKPTEFINIIKDGAIASMRKHGVLASITIAQAILESSWGKSALSVESKNLFGVKAIGGWRGNKKLYPTYEWIKGVKTKINDYFRVYSSYVESIEDHVLFLVNNSRYKSYGLFSAKNYIGQANALQSAGYATDPNYAKQLIQLIVQYQLNQYDVVSTKEYAINYCLEWQKFYNKVTQTKSPLITDGDYGVNTQKSLDSIYAYIREGKKYRYCLEFQKFYNQVTKTKAPIAEDGSFGPATQKCLDTMQKLIKGEY